MGCMVGKEIPAPAKRMSGSGMVEGKGGRVDGER